MLKTYTLAEIRSAWTAYKEATGLYVLKDGEWSLSKMKGGKIDGVKAEMRTLRSMMGFPEYLEQMWKN